MSNTKICFLYLFISSSLMGADIENSTNDEAFYRTFITSISDFEMYTNEDVNELIMKGITSDDEAIQDLTLNALAFESRRALENNDDRRAIEEIPDLKNYLLERIYSGLPEYEDFKKAKQVPMWWLAFTPLSTHYKQDPDVENLLIHSIEMVPDALGNVLQFLNFGLFDSRKVQQIRYDALLDDDANVVSHAAMGIGMTTPDDGLQHLVGALGRRDSAIPIIVVAIHNYGERSAEYLVELDEVLADMRKIEEGQYFGPRYSPLIETAVSNIRDLLQ